MEYDSDEEDCNDEEDYGDTSTSQASKNGSDHTKKNYLDLSKTAGASLRFGVSSSATAAVCTGFLADQIKGEILPPEMAYLAVDKFKIQRAKTKVMKESQEKDEKRNQEDVITGIFSDGRKDKTKYHW